MSDSSQGPGWWIASDGKWYSPEQQPGPATPDPTEQIPVTPPPAATPAPTAAPEPIVVPPPIAPMSAPPMMTPPGSSYAAPPVPPPVAPPAKKGGNGCLKAALIVGAIIVVLGIGTIAALAFLVNKGVSKLDAAQKAEKRTGISSASFNTEHPPQDDLASDWTCTTTAGGFPEVTGTVENNSSKASTYTIVVEFKQNGTQFTTGSGIIVSVDPGATAEFTATGSVAPTGQFSCKIDQVDRFDTSAATGN